MSAAVWLQIALEFCGNTWLERYPTYLSAGYAIVAPKVAVHSVEEGQELLDPEVGQDIAIDVHNVQVLAADQVQHPLLAQVVRADGVIVQSGHAIANRNWLGGFDAVLKLGPIPVSGTYSLRLVPITVANPPVPITALPRLTGRARALTVNVVDVER
jgi:hypothetical protein